MQRLGRGWAEAGQSPAKCPAIQKNEGKKKDDSAKNSFSKNNKTQFFKLCIMILG
jgi:hypothetical protein